MPCIKETHQPKPDMKSPITFSTSFACYNPNDSGLETVHESTYALLMRSEERERGAFEVLAYGLLVLCGVFSMWQFGHQSITLPVRVPTASSHLAAAANCTVADRS